MTNLAGSGHTESRDGCDLTASFSQPTGVCCEKDSHPGIHRRLRLITSVEALLKYFNLAGTKRRLSSMRQLPVSSSAMLFTKKPH